MNKILFSSSNVNYSTPKDLYCKLNEIYKFDFDPCPLNSNFDGLKMSWENSKNSAPFSSIIVIFLGKQL